MEISWVSESNLLLLNPKLSCREKLHWQKAYDWAVTQKKEHGSIFILTSGTSGEQKLVCLKKQAILANAKAVNEHLHVKPTEAWLNPLPHFHIGGLSIYARAYLSNSPVYSLDTWDPEDYVKQLKNHRISFSSLVPTQVYDLVAKQLEAPTTLRAIVVGGSHLANNLLQKARDLGYPLLPSYGSSELASQIATATYTDDRLHLLSHIDASTTSEGKLLIRSPSLFSYYVKNHMDSFTIVTPIMNSTYFESEDLVELEGKTLKPLGRGSEYVKIMGEAVSLIRIESLIEKEISDPYSVLALPDERKGSALVLVVESRNHEMSLNAARTYNQNALGFERIESIYYIEKLPRTELGKIKKEALKQDILSGKLASHPV